MTYWINTVSRGHVERGVAIVDRMIADLGLSHLPPVAILRRIVAGHHEHLDGTGYPAGARGDAVPLKARIVTVADIFDALTSIRPYKSAWPMGQALDELADMVAAGKLDAAAVEALRRRIAEVCAVRDRFTDGAPKNISP